MSNQTDSEPIRISVDEAASMVEDQAATVLDVVDTVSYDDVPIQIQGAVRIAPEDVADDYDRLPTDRSVLTY